MTTLEAMAHRVAQGEVLGDDAAGLLFASHDLITIGMMADDLRRRLHGSRTTFLRVLEMHVDAVPAAPPSELSAGELRLIGRPASLEGACAAVEQARRWARDVLLTGFSLADLASLGAATSAPFDRLRSAGLDGIAAAPIDEIDAAAIESARAAGLLVHRMVVNRAPQDPVNLIARAVELQNAVGGFRAFAPLPRRVPVATPTTGYDDVKLVAVARLMVREIPSIQVDWPLYGPKLAQVALTMGADDVDGVAAVEAGALGPRRSALEEISGNIRAAGLEAIERDGRFEVRAS